MVESEAGAKTKTYRKRARKKKKTEIESFAPEPEYGCLKNGKKPTYSAFHRTMKNNVHREKISFVPFSQNTPTVINRKARLEELKIGLKPKIIPRPSQIRRTIKIHRLGKHVKGGTVSVLIKSNATIKNVKTEQNILRNRELREIREYLRKHNMIKVGTTAPEDVLRKLYEDSFMAGNIYNRNSDNLIHNYLKENSYQEA